MHVRASITMIRCGFPSNEQGPTFFLPPGKVCKPVYCDQFLLDHGAAPGSTVIMTESGFLTDHAWKEIVPSLIKGIRQAIREHAATLGIDGPTADQLLCGLTFDGFKSHLKNLVELKFMAENNIIAAVEGRDSSEINQAFDKFVARAGKRRAEICLDNLRRSHITPIIDGWMLILVGLSILRDCKESQVWENSFIAVNMHPHYRISLEDWMVKIAPFVVAADKFETEVIDELALLPADWKKTPFTLRQEWLKLISDDGASWDVDLIRTLRQANMNLTLLKNIFKIYQAEKRIANKRHMTTPRAKAKTMFADSDKGKMHYHVFNPNVTHMTPEQKFRHAITVRNRTLGPIKGTTVSPHLDVVVTPDNERFLRLTPDDVNMHRVLQESTCTTAKRRRVAKRSLNALGGVSGICGFVNDAEKLKEIELNLKFADSLETIKTSEKAFKRAKAVAKHKVNYEKAQEKLQLDPNEKFSKCHAEKLTVNEMKAVAFFDCGGAHLSGKAQEIREQLTNLLPHALGIPDYETQDVIYEGVYSDDDADSDETTQDEDDLLSIIDLKGDELVEVYWVGEKKWFEGRVTGISLSESQFEIYYPEDKEKLWHKASEYSIRRMV